jgi:hypothetical protein
MTRHLDTVLQIKCFTNEKWLFKLTTGNWISCICGCSQDSAHKMEALPIDGWTAPGVTN